MRGWGAGGGDVWGGREMRGGMCGVGGRSEGRCVVWEGDEGGDVWGGREMRGDVWGGREMRGDVWGGGR